VKRFLPFGIIGLALVGAMGFGLYLKHPAEGSSLSVSRLSSAAAEAHSLAPPTKGADPPHSKGAVVSKITLEEFGDFECPACGKLYPMLKKIESEYGNRIQIVFREFPLPQHKYAVRASRAAEAAGLQGKFWEMHDLLYENRNSWSTAADVRPIFDDYARRLRLNVEKFNSDQNSKVVGERLTQDFQRGRSLRIKATPTLYLNGNEVPYTAVAKPEELRALLDTALVKANP
jgi:protein-disulfide isomerase